MATVRTTTRCAPHARRVVDRREKGKKDWTTASRLTKSATVSMLNCRTTSTSSSATKAHCSAWTTNPLRRRRTSEPQKTVRRPPHGFFFGYTTDHHKPDIPQGQTTDASAKKPRRGLTRQPTKVGDGAHESGRRRRAMSPTAQGKVKISVIFLQIPLRFIEIPLRFLKISVIF